MILKIDRRRYDGATTSTHKRLTLSTASPLPSFSLTMFSRLVRPAPILSRLCPRLYSSQTPPKFLFIGAGKMAEAMISVSVRVRVGVEREYEK